MTIFLQAALVLLALGALFIAVTEIRRRRVLEAQASHPPPRSWVASNGLGAEIPTGDVARRTASGSVPAEPSVRPDGSVSPYRVRPGSSQDTPRWDPYAEDQSRAHRAQAARRKPRPAKSGSHARDSAEQEGLALDHYSLLGVRPNATGAEIEQAYRRYAAEIHPDRFFDDPARRRQAEQKLKQLNAAMQVLRDPRRRASYDESR